MYTIQIFYINEALSLIELTSLETVAKKLGFKFVWYRHGKFLTRLKEGMQVHTFKSVSDVVVLANRYNSNNANDNNTNYNYINSKNNNPVIPTLSQCSLKNNNNINHQ